MPLPLIIIIVILVIIFLILSFMWFYYQSTAPANCSLQKRKLLKDKCMGGCPAGEVCINTLDRPYGPFGLGGTQHLMCNCAPTAWAAGLSTPGSGDS
jgi:hypothetical protein